MRSIAVCHPTILSNASSNHSKHSVGEPVSSTHRWVIFFFSEARLSLQKTRKARVSFVAILCAPAIQAMSFPTDTAWS